MMVLTDHLLGGSVRVAYISEHGIIVELDDDTGVRLVSSQGLVGPVFRSAAPIANHMPYTDWVEADGSVDLEAWLDQHGVQISALRPAGPDDVLSIGGDR